MPQFSRSVLVLVHFMTELESPTAQDSKEPGQAQALAVQIWPLSHLLPQLPQFAGLFVVFKQSGGSPHAEVFVGQVHAPAVQVRPPVQVIPHPPQFAPSV